VKGLRVFRRNPDGTRGEEVTEGSAPDRDAALLRRVEEAAARGDRIAQGVLRELDNR